MTSGKKNATNLRLRAMEPADVDMMYALENDQTLWCWSDTTAPYARHTLLDWIANNTNDAFSYKQLRLVVECQGQPIGCADLFRIDPLNRRAEVGIALLEGWRGQGWGTTAVMALCHFAKQHLGMNQLFAVVAENNLSAKQLFSACAFTHTATLQQWILRSGTPQDALVFQKLL